MRHIAANLLDAALITLIIPVVWLQGLKSTGTHISAIIYAVIVVAFFVGSFVLVDKADERK